MDERRPVSLAAAGEDPPPAQPLRPRLRGSVPALQSEIVAIRDATADDADFLLDMLVEACNWSGEQRVRRRDLLSHPYLRRYLDGWPALSDFGLVAVADDGTSLGAVWARLFSAGNPGYGFVASDVPEISMAIVASARGRGIERRLLAALSLAARQKGWRALSLSVEDENPAVRLYRAEGFVTVGRVENANSMLLDLGA